MRNAYLCTALPPNVPLLLLFGRLFVVLSRRTPSVGRTVVARVFVVVVKHLSVVSSSHRRGVVAHSYVVLLVRSGRPVVRPSSVEAV